jgi:hypothetical protein
MLVIGRARQQALSVENREILKLSRRAMDIKNLARGSRIQIAELTLRFSQGRIALAGRRNPTPCHSTRSATLAFTSISMMTRTFLALAVLVGLAGFGAEHSHASIQAYAADASTGSLYSIDPTTGSSSLVNSGNYDASLGLAYNASTSTMYSLGYFNGRISTVNLVTGSTTLVTTSTVSGLTGLTFSGDFSTLYSLQSNGGPLVAINPVTGISSIVGGSPVTDALDLATDSSGNVYAGGLSGIALVNTLTGNSTLIGGALQWTAIAFDDSDTLYGIEINSNSLYKINTSTGVATLVGGSIGADARGMAFVFDRSTPGVVPEPTSVLAWGLLGAAGLAVSRWRAS